MKVAISTLGCKVNQYETQAMEQELRRRGHEIVDFSDAADAYVVNSCSVTAVSDRKSRQQLYRIRREHPAAVAALCGCYVQTHLDEVRKLDVDLLAGTGGRMEFLDRLESAVMEKQGLSGHAPAEFVDQALRRREFEVLPAGGLGGRTRAMLKVEDGCVNFCTYCIVPYVRGREKSRKPGDILAEFRGLVEAGYKEITLLGQNVNSYGKGLEEKVDFSDLLNLLCTVPGDYHIRFMTSHPKDASRKLIDTIAAQDHLCKHIHLPVQSGSDRILKEMNRHYTVAQYMDLVNYAKEKIPGVTFSSDIIVGFPGETEEDFQATLDLIQQVKYMQLFTFIYSKRTGTIAAKLPDPATHAEKAARMDRLLKLQDSIAFPMIAAMYRNISIAEKGHEERYLAFVKNIEVASVFAKEGEVIWQCRNCGYIEAGKEAPEVCPACLHPQAYFEIKKENY